MSNAYEASGVNIEQGYEAVERMKKHIDRTKRQEVMSQVGGFGGLFSLASHSYKEPVLVSGTDGVGTKILLAQQAGILNTVGIDCVAMCVNDVLAQGAEPLFFLDYLAVGHNDPSQIEQLVAGVAEGCVQAGAALIGGETAEMPDLYAKDEFDLAGFCVGIADKSALLDRQGVKEGDILIGLPSSGVHSNGFSLVRKIFFKDHQWSFDQCLSDGTKLIDALLTPTKIYVKDLMPLVKQGLIHGMAHITGGGFYENVPRMFNEDLCAHVQVTSWEKPLIFSTMQELGNIPEEEMYQVFNMGVGMVIAVAPENVDTVLASLPQAVKLGHMTRKTTTEQANIVLNFTEVEA
ncbi:phosphoribosylformylglycinamidine cyclo-ligase [Vaginisenegalia massiliensis]|uniref:phosphoribosylformylglycinamidine cyclo-ligase n=1 Tax=Vaginisenegalia massiliensis TaxID=2058294 RepID=UPI000F52974F|nr:phosphoribosylformylglycinamidine cyclo-ligase [Vaginisenegalia massiliensis]